MSERVVRIESLTALLAFMDRHGGSTVAEIDGRDEVGFTQWDEGRTKVTFPDGARIEFDSDYEPDYSEVTAGRGFTLTIIGYEPNGDADE